LSALNANIIRFGDDAATLTAYTSGQVDVLVTGNIAAVQLAVDSLQWVNVFILQKKLGGELDVISEEWFGQPLPPLPTF
jgi:polar amino acid transport system substrate-binding protein